MALTINLEDHFNYTLLELHGEVNANTAVILQKSIDISTENGHRHLGIRLQYAHQHQQ